MQFELERFQLSDAHLGIIFELLRHTDNVFIVGGAVRDVLGGIKPHDVDVATDLRPSDLSCIFGKKAQLTGNRFPTVRVKHQGVEIEVSTFRKEIGNQPGRKACTPVFSDSIVDDLARRDLTVNALALEVLTGKVFDEFAGAVDLDTKVVRFVGNPLDRISEDPIRILRAIRFRARIGGTFAPETLKALCSEEARQLFLDLVPKEQVKAEILKGLESPAPFSTFFTDLLEFGLLGDLFPEFLKAATLDGGKHHAETVLQHCLLVGDAFKVDDLNDPKDRLARLAAYLHDYGKPAAFDPETGRFSGHHAVGADLVRQLLLSLRFSQDETEFVCKLVQNHMRRPGTLKGVRRLVFELQDDLTYLLKLFDADSAGNLNPDNREDHDAQTERVREQIAEVTAVSPTFLVLNVNGFDLLKTFNLKPGPKVGELLKVAREFVLEDPALNERSVLLDLLKAHV